MVRFCDVHFPNLRSLVPFPSGFIEAGSSLLSSGIVTIAPAGGIGMAEKVTLTTVSLSASAPTY